MPANEPAAAEEARPSRCAEVVEEIRLFSNDANEIGSGIVVAFDYHFATCRVDAAAAPSQECAVRNLGSRTESPFRIYLLTFRRLTLFAEQRNIRPSTPQVADRQGSANIEAWRLGMAISCYAYADLQRHIDALRRPKVARALGRVGEGLEFKVGYGAASVTIKPTNWFFSERARYRYATLEWIRAKQPHLGLKDLDRLQTDLGLTNQTRQLFLARLQDECARVATEDVELQPWLWRRTGLLEFETMPRPRFREELQDAVVGLRADYERALWEAASSKVEQAVLRANGVSRRALKSAGEVVVSLFSRTNECRFSASLMLLGEVGPVFISNATFQRNARDADTIWADLGHTGPRLTVVAETKSADQTGFWVPIRRGDTGEEIPGATAAYTNRIGSAVFKHDLPPLTGLPTSVAKLWQVHMEQKFGDTLFVSLPLKLPSEVPGSSTVCAVLNVNADADMGYGWERAVHREWLEVARDRVAQFLEVGFKALVLMNEASHRALFPELPSIADPWGSLPGRPDRGLSE